MWQDVRRVLAGSGQSEDGKQESERPSSEAHFYSLLPGCNILRE